MDNLRFSSIAKRYATGISFTVRSKIAYRRSPRVRTPAAYFKAHSRPFATPFSRSPFMTWPSKAATALWENAPPGHFLIPQGELRTADVYRPALPVVLGLRCECQLYGTTASQVPVLCSMGAQCGSTTCFCGVHLRVRRRAWRYCMKTLKTIYLFYILNRNYKKFHIFFVDSSKRFQKDIFLRSAIHGCSG